MTQYVLGFLFSDTKRSVVLIRKTRPEWQRGLLNGVGGHIEPGECDLDAMVREFHEETGVVVVHGKWKKYCDMVGQDFSVACFKAFDSNALLAAMTTGDEIVEKHDPATIWSQKCISNLPWLINLALDHNTGQDDLYVVANYGTQSK